MELGANKILIVGGNSFLGERLRQKLTEDGFDVVVTTRRVDFSSSEFLDLGVENLEFSKLPKDVDWVVVCAAITNANECEKNTAYSSLINVTAPIDIARYYSQFSIPTLLISTDFIFQQNIPCIGFDASKHPVGEYGRQKVQMESIFLKEGLLGAICRFGKILSPTTRIIQGWKDRLHAGENVPAFCDYHTAPISIDLAINTLEKIIRMNGSQIFQLSGCRAISYFEFAKAFAARLNGASDLVVEDSYFLKFGKSAPNRNQLTLDNSRVIEELQVVVESQDELLNCLIR